MSTSGLAWRPSAFGRLPAAMLLATLVAAAVLAFCPLPWAGALVLASCTALLILSVPMAGLLLIVFAVPFGSPFYLSLGDARVGATEALVWLVLGVWLMRMVARRQVRLAPSAVGIALSLLLATMLVSLLAASSLLSGMTELVKWIEVLGLFAFVSGEVDARWLRSLVAASLLAGGVSAMQGIQQFVTQEGPEAFLLSGRFMRAYGAFAQPNPYAGYLGLGATLALGVAIGCLVSRQRERRAAWLSWALTAATLMTSGVVMSWSRGSWLGLVSAVCAMAIAAAVQRRGRLVLPGLLVVGLFGVLLIAALGGLPEPVVSRIADFVPFIGVRDVRGIEVTDANFSLLERMAHWQAAIGMWKDHPWIGVGIGNYAIAYEGYSLPGWDEALGHAHNYYLNIAAETGVLGLLAYVSVWLLAAAAAWRACHRATGFRAGLALGILGALVYLTVHNMFDNLFVHGIYLQVAILLGLITKLRGESR